MRLLAHSILAVGFAIVSAITLACATKPVAATDEAQVVDEDAAPATPWLKRRAQPTKVRPTQRPSPRIVLDDTMERVHYTSAAGSLLAVVARPPTMPLTADTPTERLPGVVLLHEGLALSDDTLAWAKPFVDDGFAVLLPSYRGENGNPGNAETMRGEVDDVIAATRFFADEPDVDVDRLYVFGHSMGGGIVALLALDPNVPFRIFADSNGVFSATTFLNWQRSDPNLVPFDVKGPAGLDERTVRALMPNAHELVHPLTILLGDKDTFNVEHTAVVKQRAPPKMITVYVLPGDHMGSLPAALAKFHELVVADAFAKAPQGPRVSARAERTASPVASRSAP